jgi:hypothetical protein
LQADLGGWPIPKRGYAVAIARVRGIVQTLAEPVLRHNPTSNRAVTLVVSARVYTVNTRRKLTRAPRPTPDEPQLSQARDSVTPSIILPKHVERSRARSRRPCRPRHAVPHRLALPPPMLLAPAQSRFRRQPRWVARGAGRSSPAEATSPQGRWAGMPPASLPSMGQPPASWPRVAPPAL